MGRRTRLALFLALLVLAAALVAVAAQRRIDLAAFRAYVASLGAFGWALLLVAAFVATIVLFPLSPLGVIAGALYGFLPATAALLIGGTSAGLLAFYALRHGLSPRLARWARSRGRAPLPAPAKAPNWILLVFLVRVLPIVPYGTATYVFAFTRAPTRDYAIGSLLGLLPVAGLSAWLGSRAIEIHHPADLLRPDVWVPFALLVVLSLLGIWLKPRWPQRPAV